jgi:single-strand DNA-binding protein
MTNSITITGNITADPEIKFLPSGVAVASFTIADTPRVFNKDTGEWKDGDTLFLRCNLWRDAAENVAESLQKGARVVVSGHLKQRTFDGRDGDKKSMIELEVEEVGPSLKYARAQVTKQKRDGGSGAFAAATSTPAPAGDLWGVSDDEPPF